jgi:single-strand DNA-binding protein
MASVNKVILVGNLGKDPEVRYLPSGDQVANITIATSSRYKSKSGEMVEETEWHRVTFFGRLAEIASQYLKKGRPVYIEGRIKTNKYTDKNGVERYSTDVIASEMQLLGSREGMGEPSQSDDDGAYNRQAPARQAPQARQAQPVPAQPIQPVSGFEALDDDIPF